jgi:sugar lactone lactonase YvrE
MRLPALPLRSLRAQLPLFLLALAGLMLPMTARGQATFTGALTTVASGFNQPTGIAVDSNGNVYMVVFGGNQQLKATPQPDGTYIQTNLASGLSFPCCVAVDANGNVFIPNTLSNSVVELTPSGSSYTQTTLALNAGVSTTGIAVDASGNLYVASVGNQSVFKETPIGGGAYTATTIVSGLGNGGPYGVAVDLNGNVYIADTGDSQVLVETPSGGSYTQTTLGTGLSGPTGVAVDAQGNVYITDSGNNRLLKETLLSGSYTQTTLGVGLSNPAGVALDSSGNLFIANDGGGNFVELHTSSVPFGSQAVNSASNTISLPFTISSGTTVGSVAILTTGIAFKDFADAGSSTCTAQTYSADTTCVVNVNFKPLAAGLRHGAVVISDGAGNVLASVSMYGNGTGPQAAYTPGQSSNIGSGLSGPGDLTVDAAGNVYIADNGNSRVLKVTPGGSQSTVGSGLAQPSGVAIDGAGNVYISDTNTEAVWVVTPAGAQTEFVTGLQNPLGLALDGAGNLYICNGGASQILKVTPAGAQTQLGAGFSFPTGVAVDGFGNAYVSDIGSGNIIEVTPGGVTTTAVSGLDEPGGVTVDAAGNLYIAVFGNGQLVEVTPGGLQTIIMSTGTNLAGVALDTGGNLYYTDLGGSMAAEIDRVVPPALAFATTQRGATSTGSPQIVSVQNIGNAALNFSAINYPADFPEAGSATGDCTGSTQLAMAGSCTLSIDFSPVTEPSNGNPSVLLSESVNITSNTLNVPGTQQAIAVTGTGLASPFPFSFLPSSLTFAPTYIGATSAAQTVTVTNTGTTAAAVKSYLFTGANASAFVITQKTCSTSLAAGASCTLSIAFQPTANGSLTANLAATDNATGSPQAMTLAGTGATATISLSPSSLAFASTYVGLATAAQTVTVTNTGVYALPVKSYLFTGANASSFVLTGKTCSASLAAGASCTLSIAFQPTANGSLTASLAAMDIATGSPQLVGLTGTGVTATISLSPSSLIFASTNIGSTSAAQTVTVTNTGIFTLPVQSYLVTGANASSYLLTGKTCSTSLAAGSSCTLSIAFRPTANGSLTANLAVTDIASGSPQTIGLSGTGVTATISLSPSGLTFPSTNVGSTSASQTITVTNTGVNALTVQSYLFTGANASSFLLTQKTCSTSLAAGASCTLWIAFKPTATGTATASLIANDSAAGSPQSIGLSGTTP